MATERQAPDALSVQTNCTGAVTDIDEDPDSPDANWLAWDGSGTYLGGYDIATSSDAITWSEFQDLDPITTTWGNTYDFSEAIVTRIMIRTGGGGVTEEKTSYLDDFTLNGVPVVVENGFTVIPEPLTMAAVFCGVAAVGGYLRKRRMV